MSMAIACNKREDWIILEFQFKGELELQYFCFKKTKKQKKNKV